MNELTKGSAPATTLQSAVNDIALFMPSLDELSSEQLEAIAKMVIAQNLTADLDRKVKAARVDWETEKETFLKTAKSANTKAAYRRSIERLERYATDKDIELATLTAKEADDYIYALTATGRASAAVRLDIAAASAFYSFLARRYEGTVKNNFQGTKARPASKAKKDVAVPTAVEVQTIISALPPDEAAAVTVCAFRGLRVGALPTLTATAGGKYNGFSKGKELKGVTLPRETVKAIEAAGLDLSAPFAGLNVNLLKRMFDYRMKKLVKAGAIAAKYSHHDLRHFYAVNQYREHKDIYALKALLNHASIAITERYLKSMGIEI
jgi:site-specific recombinase XerD